jgi:uncharacterized protein YhbP (UPF0306 family)
MRQKKLDDLAKAIIGGNIYMTLATAGPSPWASPVFYCTDRDSTFYFMSQMHSRHTKAILANHRVAFAIFDSRQPEGTGNGVQGYGRAFLVSPRRIREALKWYRTKFINVKNPNPYRLFFIKPKKIFILDPEKTDDVRVEVHIKKSVPI